MNNETGFVGIVGKASGDFMREFTTAWRGGVPVPPIGPELRAPAPAHPAGVAPAGTPRASTRAQATVTTPHALEARLAALEQHVKILEQARCGEIVNDHALHMLLNLVAKELDIQLPAFGDIVTAAMATIAEIQFDLDSKGIKPDDISFEKLVKSPAYNEMLEKKLKALVKSAGAPSASDLTDG